MSEEFIKEATNEIVQDLEDISSILQSCEGDNDITKNSGQIEKHMHRIKGLAPMMGKVDVGELAKILDSLLKYILTGKKIDGFFAALTMSIEQMKIAMKKPHDLTQIQKQISDISLKIKE